MGDVQEGTLAGTSRLREITLPFRIGLHLDEWMKGEETSRNFYKKMEQSVKRLFVLCIVFSITRGSLNFFPSSRLF